LEKESMSMIDTAATSVGVRAHEEVIGFVPKGLKEGIGCMPMGGIEVSVGSFGQPKKKNAIRVSDQ